VVTGEGPRFVSRGGEKLDAALTRFADELTVEGCTAIDAGASTGGFTDCLLQRGAAHVYAVDVGHGQLHPRLRTDPRVSVHERTTIRTLTGEALSTPERPFRPVDLVTADLSFISLGTVAPVLCGPVLREGGELVVLVKPQFEAGRVEVSRGRGVITDPEQWRQTVAGAMYALEANGTGIMGVMPSPITGPAGNHEFLVHARRGAGAAGTATIDRLVSAAVDEAAGTAIPVAEH
jgi:23S rRNA (cytidine1920-2'-O)/16S rRNA (cytidine1409-2'-O)-methyltransferase